MDPDFIRAFRRDRHEVCGVRLNPLSLSLILALEQAGSPFCRLWRESDHVELTHMDMFRAICCCAAKPPKMKWLLKIKCFGFPLSSTYSQMSAYFIDHLSRCPEVVATGDGAGRINGPWILAKSTFVQMHSNFTHSELWSMPLPELLWHAASIGEQLGSIEIIDEEQRRIFDEVERRRSK